MDKYYYIQKYENRMEEIFRNLTEQNVDDIDYACTIEFDQTANAEEVVGYYLTDGETSALKRWLENIEGIDLTEQDKEVTRILTELSNN